MAKYKYCGNTVIAGGSCNNGPKRDQLSIPPNSNWEGF